jgi:NADH pyrophosphatase NudC (nudix superfamily)
MEKLVTNIVSVWVLEDRRNLEHMRAVKWAVRQLFPKLAYLLDELCLLTQRAADLPTGAAKYDRCPECGTPLEVVFDPSANR